MSGMSAQAYYAHGYCPQMPQDAACPSPTGPQGGMYDTAPQYADPVADGGWPRPHSGTPPVPHNGASPVESVGYSRTDSAASRGHAAGWRPDRHSGEGSAGTPVSGGSFAGAHNTSGGSYVGGHNTSGGSYSQSSGTDLSDAERRQRRARRRTFNGQTIVTTPWFPDGAIKEQVTLTTEVTSLAALVSLNLKERAARNALRSHLQEAAARAWPEATVKVYGSFAYDCSLPESALDLVCENCVDLSNFQQNLGEIAAECGLKIEHLYEQEVEGERHAFAKLTGAECGVVANVTFVENKSPARAAVLSVRRLLKEFPACREVFACVRQVLKQSGVADAADGGLAPYAVLLMVFHAAQRSAAPHDAGQLLVDFFTLYSNPSEAAIDARKKVCEPKECPKNILWVCDLVGGGNVADGCIKAPQVQTVCAYCASTLAKWSSGQWDGYRGRSPLSSILAYDVLWDRANA